MRAYYILMFETTYLKKIHLKKTLQFSVFQSITRPIRKQTAHCRGRQSGPKN